MKTRTAIIMIGTALAAFIAPKNIAVAENCPPKAAADQMKNSGPPAGPSAGPQAAVAKDGAGTTGWTGGTGGVSAGTEHQKQNAAPESELEVAAGLDLKAAPGDRNCEQH